MTDTGKSVFGSTGGGIFGAPFTTNTSSTTGGGTSTTTTPLFGLGGTSTGLGNTTNPNPFSTPKPTEQGGSTSATTPAQKVPNFFNIPASSTTSTTFGSTSGGLFGKPTDNTAKVTTTTTTTGTSLGAGSTSNGGLFGKKPETNTSTTTPAAPSSLGFTLGGNKDASTTTATTTAPSGGLFSNLNANKEKDNPGATTSSAPTFNLFGPPKDATEKKDAPPAAPFFSLGVPNSSKDSDKQPSTSSETVAAPATTAATATSTNTAISVAPPSALRGKTIEEIINKWSAELETHVREFSKFAGEVAVWDRALIENGNNLAALYSHVLAAEREQNDIDQSLDHIEHQQKDLAATLEAYEKSTQEILGGQGGSLRALDTGPADTERDKNYMLATDLHTHLDDLSTSLTQIIESVNTLSHPASDFSDGASKAGEDPIAQISQILSSHLESLQWIDGAVREVEGKVTEIEKRVKESGGSLVAPSSNGARYRGLGLNR